MECVNCFTVLEFDSNGEAVCPKCGTRVVCTIRKYYDMAEVVIDCKGCRGGNRYQNFNVIYCRRTDYILRIKREVIWLPWSKEPSVYSDELRPRPAMADKKLVIEVYSKQQFKDWHRTLERPPERLLWPEPLKVVQR